MNSCLGYDQLEILVHPQSNVAESYRLIRSIIEQQHISTILISPILNEDSQLTILSNAAATFALGGYKSIIVDTNLRNPSLHRIWNIDNTDGISKMLADNSSLKNPPFVASNIENLYLLPSGASELYSENLISRNRLLGIVETLKEHADFVFFSSGPLLRSANAIVLAQMIDQVLLVVQRHKSTKAQIAKALEILKPTNIHPMSIFVE